MTYGELLLDSKWKSKRNLIVQRDNAQCQRCFNSEIIEQSKVGTLVELTCEDNQLTALLNADDPRFRAERPKYKLRFRPESSSIELEKNIYILGWHEQPIIDKLVGCPVFYNYESADDTFGTNSDETLVINGIKKSNKQSNDWFHVNNLHVHHTFYQQGKLPWEYPCDSLITLCWYCHIKLHENETVPNLNEQGVEIGRLTYCLRCWSAGYFPQYSHVDNGICFRCEGARYEELIKKKR